jgi:hypothetical protein
MNALDNPIRPRASGAARLVILVLLASMAMIPLYSLDHLNAQVQSDVGFVDFSYGNASAPTGQKPQSKLWFNDGNWWGSLYSHTTKSFNIHRYDWHDHTWVDTGVLIDSRRRSSADVLWDGSRLYIASAFPPGPTGDTSAMISRYSYHSDTRTYTLDSGFPVVITDVPMHAIVMDKDTTGRLWITYTGSYSGGYGVYVTHTITDDSVWVEPFLLPAVGADNLFEEDISAIVAFNSKIGIMWSNQQDDAFYFATRLDGAPTYSWSVSPALQAPGYADDHINLAALQSDASGQVFAAVKTSQNDVNPPDSGEPLILLLTLKETGSWSRRTVGRVRDNHTRPIVLVDQENREVYVFATVPRGSLTAGDIFYKKASIDDPSMQFPAGLGTPFIINSVYDRVNNVTSTKQSLNNSTNLVVLAGDDTGKMYLHNRITLVGSTPQPTATATSTPIPTATPLPTETAQPSPTATAPGEIELFSDGFESGDLTTWSTVHTGADGVALVQTQTVHTGAYSAMLSASSTAGSRAYIRVILPAPEWDLKIEGDILVAVEGANSANVPIFRLFDTSGVRVVSLYRQNLSGNRIRIHHSGVHFNTSGTLPLNTWARFELRVITDTNGNGIITVHLDDDLIYYGSASLSSSGLLSLQLGNETARQTFQIYADNVSIWK